MFDSLTRIIPAETLGACALSGAVWYGAHFFVITPEYSERMADLTYQPICMASMDRALSKEMLAYQEERKRIEAQRQKILDQAKAEAARAKRQMDAGKALLDKFIPRGAVGELENALGLPGVFGDLTGGTSVPDYSDGLKLPSLPRMPVQPTSQDVAGRCACVIHSLQGDHHWEIAAYTASASLYQPQIITQFEDALHGALASGRCVGAKGRT